MSHSSGTLLDKRRVRMGFNRNAVRYEQANFLAREVAERMGERLDLLRATPATVLDLGSGTGLGARMLRARYPKGAVIEIDFALKMLTRARASESGWRRAVHRLTGEGPLRVCGDIEHLPFRERSFDMVWSNLALHWTDLPVALAEAYRVLLPNGVFMFSTLGPDTLKELRSSFGESASFVHVNRFADLHDIGDMMVEARFADPVMDMECITLTYDSIDVLLGELRAMGGRNANLDRPSGLGGRRTLASMRAAYEAHRRDGRLPVTVEVVYGHAWRPAAERLTASDEAVIEFHPRKR